jgi:hypothetical protein
MRALAAGLALLVAVAAAESGARAQAEPAPADYVPPARRVPAKKGRGANANDTNANGTNANDTNANGTNANGTNANGTNANGTNANGTNANSTNANGTNANGTNANGAKANGTNVNDTNENNSNENNTNENDSNANGGNENDSSAGGEGEPNESGANGAMPNRPPKPPLPAWNLAVAPRLSVLLGDSAAGIPNVGYGAAVRLHGAFLPLGPLRLGAGIQFAYDRFARDKPGASFGSTTQLLSHASFAAIAILDAIFGRARPWVGLGGGFSVAEYQDPTVQGSPPVAVSLVTVVPMVTIAFGVGVRLYRGFELGLRGDVDVMFSSQAAGTPPRTVFSPGVFGLSLDLGFRF